MRTIRRLLGDRKAATAVEYGLILSLIVIAIIGGLQMFASTTIGMWNNVSTAVVTAG
ncbi:MAG TPA: Flp family type IVb pilin [Allosphingosinicella sp.]|nr:Flp family type IVb pilin [Allosphingosinicella sp.]